MVRRLSAEERALWRKLTATVRPLRAAPMPGLEAEGAFEPPAAPRPVRPSPMREPATRPARRLGDTLDASWDRRLGRGLAKPDTIVDLHGHGLAAAHALLEDRLGRAVERGDRLMLLIAGRPPKGEERPAARGVIRAAVGDWLTASRHAGDIAAIRNAHPRHGGAGALYIVLRRKR